jgi:hypothetical protein
MTVIISYILKLLFFHLWNEFVVFEFIIENVHSWFVFAKFIINILVIIFFIIILWIISYIARGILFLESHDFLKQMASIDFLNLINFIGVFSFSIGILFLILNVSWTVYSRQVDFLIKICTFNIFNSFIQWVDFLINFNLKQSCAWLDPAWRLRLSL